MDLNSQEKSIIENALSYYFHDAHKQLEDKGVYMPNGQKRGLGDIEREQLEQRVELIKLVLKRFNAI